MGRFRIGELNEEITIQHEVQSGSDPVGQPITSWEKFASAFAAVRPLKSRERFRADRFIAEDFKFFVIRWIPGVTPKMRISYNDGSRTRVFNIRGIDEIDERRRRFLELTGEAQE